MPFPDYIDQKPKIIFFTDFDGTITTEDMCDWLVATEGYGPEKLRQSCQAVVNGQITYREASREQLESIRIGFDKCAKKAAAYVQLDTHFRDFYKWAKSVSMPVVVLSGGLTPWIEATLDQFLGQEAQDIEIIANLAVVREGFTSIDEDGGAWRVQFRDSTAYGNDKARAIKPYAEHRTTMEQADRPILLFAGDGVSDLGAAGQTDLLFARKGQDLVDYCKREHIPFTEFEHWGSILEITQDLYYGRKSVAQIAAGAI